MTIYLLMFISYLIASQLVKGVIMWLTYRRKDYSYYNFLTSIITSTVFFLSAVVINWISLKITGPVEDYVPNKSIDYTLLLIIVIPQIIVTVIETIIFTKVFKLLKAESIIISIVTNIITFVTAIILLLIIGSIVDMIFNINF